MTVRRHGCRNCHGQDSRTLNVKKKIFVFSLFFKVHSENLKLYPLSVYLCQNHTKFGFRFLFAFLVIIFFILSLKHNKYRYLRSYINTIFTIVLQLTKRYFDAFPGIKSFTVLLSYYLLPLNIELDKNSSHGLFFDSAHTINGFFVYSFIVPKLLRPGKYLKQHIL